MKTKEIIGVILGLVALVSAVYGATEFFAKQQDLKAVAMRLDHKILEDQAAAMQQRVWALEDRYGPGCAACPADVKDEFRRLLKQLEGLQKKLEVIYRQMQGG